MKTELIQLPDLDISIDATVLASNFDIFKKSAISALSAIKTDLKTDDDFVHAEDQVKACKQIEKKLKDVESGILSKTGDINDIVQGIAAINESFRQTRLKLEKTIKDVKEGRKTEFVNEFYNDLVQYRDTCEKAITPWRLPFEFDRADVAEAGKGKKTLTSFRTALQKYLKNSKSLIDKLLEDYQEKLSIFNDPNYNNYIDLFKDMNELLTFPRNAFLETVNARIQNHKLREEQIRNESLQVQKFPEANEAPEESFDINSHPQDKTPNESISVDNTTKSFLTDEDKEQLKNWFGLTDQASAARTKSEQLKAAIIRKFFSKSSGQSQSIPIDNGFDLLYSQELLFDINVEVYTQLIYELKQLGVNTELLVTYKPVVNQNEFLKLDKEALNLFSQCINRVTFGDSNLSIRNSNDD